MKKVTAHLSSAQQDDLAAAPGETLNEKARWVLTTYWPMCLEQHRARVAAEKAAADKPRLLELVAELSNDVAEEREADGFGQVATARVLDEIAAEEQASVRMKTIDMDGNDEPH